MTNNYYKENKGFTLLELLVVITVLGILAVIGITSFTSAQVRGRDTTRKSDLKQISNSLELYFNDHGTYPGSSSGKILGCPTTSSGACSWGTSEFTDGKTIYFKVLPKDPVGGYTYYYQSVAVNGVVAQGFQLFAHLENTKDTGIITSVYTCGTSKCNFAITSPNTTPTE